MAKRKDIQKEPIIVFGPAAIGIAVLLALLLYANFADSQCVEISPFPSSQNVRITAFLDGKPIPGATVEVFRRGEEPLDLTARREPLVSLSTDDRGVAVLPQLKQGLYLIVAASGVDLGSSLYLSVAENAEGKASEFSMDLKHIQAAKMPVSNRNVRITAFLDGKPIPGATVEVFQMGEEPLDLTARREPLVSLSTDDRGVAVLPQLKQGLYRIVATSGVDLDSTLYLAVAKNAEDKASEFSIDLKPTQTAKIPVSERIQEFKGVVKDPSGAPVAGALIKAFAKDSKVKTKVLEVKADENGHFSGPLSDGTYAVFVEAPGFRTRVLVLEVDKNGEGKELHVPLLVGSCP